MDSSPEAERILLPAVSAPSPPPSSPPVQESPFFAFLRDLSPIRQTKALQYPQRFLPNKLPSPLPVFNSPHVDLRHQASFLEREKTDATGSDAYGQRDIQIKTQESPCFQKDDQSCSSPGFVDQYLADTVEEYSTNSSDLGSQADKVVPNILKGCRTSHKNTNMKADGANVIDSRARELMSDQAGEPSASLHSVETTVLKGANERTNEFRKSDNERTKEFQDLASGFVDDPVESDMCVYHFPEAEYQEQFVAQAAGNQHYKPGANRQSIPESLLCVEAHKDPLGDSKPASTTSITKENNQLPRGIRRHLQFETAKAIGQANNETHDASNSSFSDTFMLEGLVPHDVQTKEIYSSWQVGSHVQSITPGLSSEPGQCEETMGTLQETDIGEDSAQMSPKRHRKKAKCTVDIEGCKRCNCKRSKCLKLYCECFAAGVYCLDTCACENCFNKPEYEDTVLDTRQQIETRNPLAFAPKVVKPPFNSPANMSDLQEGETWTTPSSARHKRGCNCKKSKCLKRYCECYQARVGCSDGCRCEGCGNSYGKKTELRYKRAERWENPSHKHLDAFKAQSETAKLSSAAWEDLSDASHLTPLSPLPSSGLASSASLTKTDCSKISVAQWDQGSSLHPSDGYLTFNHSDASLTLALHGSKDLPEFSSDSLFHDILREADTPGRFKNTSTPPKVVVASSPNGKRVSPPQIRSRELRSSSPQELKSGRKLILQSLRSFPSLTPYSKVEGASRLSDDDKGGKSCS